LQVHHGRLCAFTIVALLLPVVLAACGQAPAADASTEGPGGGAHLTLTLDPLVPGLSKEIQPRGGALMVDRLGDPLDGLMLEVPAGAYDEPVTVSVSYYPIARGSDLADLKVLSPLLVVESSGSLAQVPLIVKIPVYMYWRHFPMAWAWDEVTGDLDPLPVLSVERNTVDVAIRSSARIIVTSHPYAGLERLNLDTGFVPGVDTWQFPNTGTWSCPEGLSWGMSLGALSYSLSEPSAAPGPLWGRYDGPAGAPATPDLWQDDVRGLRLAEALQRDFDEWRQGRPYDVIYELNRVLPGSFAVRSQRFTMDEVTFYATAVALLVTGEPQLMNVSTADGSRGLTLIAYGIQGNRILVADPNDWQRDPPERALELEYSAFNPYRSYANAQEQAAGLTTDYTVAGFVGQGALAPLDQAAGLWAEIDSLPGTVAYDLAVEAEGGSDPANEMQLDPAAPFKTSRPELQVRATSPEVPELRVSLYADGSPEPESGPVALAPGENRLGVYVEGLARWAAADGTQRSDWRWLGFDWITVIREP